MVTGAKWKRLLTSAALIMACTAAANTKPKCTEPPVKVLKDMQRLSCHEQDSSTCCGYLRNINETRACVVVLCKNSCEEPFLLEDAGCFEKREATKTQSF